MEQLTYCQQFKLYEQSVKGKTEYFIEGYISTIDPDSYNEVVTANAQKKIFSAIKGSIITMDVEHYEFLDENGKLMRKPKQTTIPAAQIVDGELRPNGVWVKAKLNRDKPYFKEILASIKGGFLHSFSIAYTPMKVISKQMGDTILHFIDDLNLNNVGITGNPVNTAGSFKLSMQAAIKAMVNTMTDETQPQEDTQPTTQPEDATPTNEPSQEPTPESTPSKLEQQIESMQKQVEEQNKLIAKQQEAITAFTAKLTASEKKPEGLPANHPAHNTMNDVGPLSAIKSLGDALSSNAKRIAQMEKMLQTPMLKSFVESEPEVKLPTKGPLDCI